MKRILLFTLFWLASMTAFCQQPRKLDFALLGADAGVRALDVYSTHRMLQGPNHEKFLPDCISHHDAAMAGYSAGVVALNWFAMRRLERHHARLARMVPLVDIAQDGPWAVRNLTLRIKR